MKQFCRYADALYRDFLGRQTDVLYRKSLEPKIINRGRLGLKVPRELLTDLSEFPTHIRPIKAPQHE
jgi:hypothetical protein